MNDAITLSAGVVKRPHVLADGRELIYFDDADTSLPPERSADARVLDPRPATARMRQDVLTGEWVSIAASRQNRVFLPPAELDPLAPASPTNPSEVPSDYDVAVFENRSPSFGPLLEDADAPSSLEDLRTLGLGRTLTSVGRCEVVCFSPEHEGSFATLSASRARTVVEAWADRVAALSALPGVQQVFPFENRGEAIGVTLHHPHGQIYSYPYVTPRTTRLLASLDAYGPGMFADVLAFERAGERVLVRGEHWTAFVPFAARWPIEVHVLPHRHVADISETTTEERDELAVVYQRLLRGIDALYDSPTPYISAWHQAPVHERRDEVRLMLQITSPRRAASKLKYLAGSEAAMGAWIGDIAPETSADALRAAIERADAATLAAETAARPDASLPDTTSEETR
ncbi:galactose-1-phosphate uridylyltransferase [Rathayibacter sp. VKM Ac-2760]|uniref:galactose-1-phosphate uridylyltransferase n=1 Tax=Rathayibacter sp. VKM Ac-2760 TaxID=2609253 RepID=UPI001316D810|nr:galactose-1-phosphate uridylyltransferase [Rathayibacter sp. VKM Ac-2760]QHC59670.1 galactose-1-phosphate uridylyltransferase [Rathayibacter sp. VKM Ac-2760]